jgi:hypothetical protein
MGGGSQSKSLSHLRPISPRLIATATSTRQKSVCTRRTRNASSQVRVEVEVHVLTYIYECWLALRERHHKYLLSGVDSHNGARVRALRDDLNLEYILG